MKRLWLIGSVLTGLAAATCSSPSSPSSPTPAASSAPAAALSISALSAAAQATPTGAVYHASLQLKETGGRSGATIASVAFAVQAQKGTLSATYTPASTQRIPPGGTLDVGAFDITDASGSPAALASQLSVSVSFVDDAGRAGTASGQGSITSPEPAPAPATTNAVDGLITDGTTGVVLPRIAVRIVDGPDAGRSATTDVAGHYGIAGISAGAISLSITAASYLPTMRRVTVSGDTRFDIVLPRCPYALSASTQAVPSEGGSYAVDVASDSECPWTTVASVPWLTVTRGAAGSGNGTIAYTAAANSGAARSGTLVVAGQTLTVSQTAAPPSAPSPPPSPPPPPTPAPATIDLTGTWSGSASDSQGPTAVTWVLTQSGSSVSGTVRTTAPNPNDGSCGSCHRNKSGTVSGTLSGSTLTLTMFFAAGASGDPTPLCSATLTGSSSPVSSSSVVASYTGADTCEGAFANGTMTMTRR